MKHNKKRNTAFLYESLVKEMTKAIIRSDMDTKDVVASILREHFYANSLLHRELGLYKTLCEVRSVKKDTAEKILSEVKRVYHSLGEQEIFDEQSEVIKKINSDLSKNIYSNFISNYKTLATISQMFNSKTPITRKIMLEGSMVDLMTSSPEEFQPMKPIDNLTYKMFVKKFNEKYGNSLNESQKDLLSKFILFTPENATEFKMYLGDEIERLKEVVKTLQTKEEVLIDESLSSKNMQILEILEGFKTQKVNDDMIRTILKVQSLTTEV